MHWPQRINAKEKKTRPWIPFLLALPMALGLIAALELTGVTPAQAATESWSNVGTWTDPGSVAALADFKGTLYAVGNNGVYSYNKTKDTWTLMSSEPSEVWSFGVNGDERIATRCNRRCKIEKHALCWDKHRLVCV